MADEPTIAVLVGVLAVIVFFADIISDVVPINLILLYLLIVIGYLSIRAVVEMDDPEARKVLLVDIGCGILIIAAVWYGFKAVGDGLSALAR